MEIITCEKAKANGQIWFFTGEPCPSGHVDKIYVVSGRCYACQRFRNHRDFHRYHERGLAQAKKTYRRNKVACLRYATQWAAAHPEKVKEIKKRWRRTHLEKDRRRRRELQKERCAKDPTFRLGRRLSKAIWHFLKGGKCGQKWVDLVGYELEQLRAHLEAQFTPEMNWGNYGTFWEVDHKRPKSWFVDFPTPEDAVRAAWALTNLQPLHIHKNRSKGNRYEH